MNKIAKTLIIVGILDIIGGFIIGFATFKTYVPGIGTVENSVILIAWIVAGAVSGIMMFGFAEIIRLLQEKRDFSKEHMNVLKDLHYEFKLLKDNLTKEEVKEQDEKSYIEETNRDSAAELRQSVSKRELEEIRNELKAKGFNNDIIESMITQKKRQLNS